MNTINKALIEKALGMTRDYTVAEVADLLNVRQEELRAAIIQYQEGKWADPKTPVEKGKPAKKQGGRKSV